MPSLLSITSHFFLQIAVILLTYRLLWPVFRRLAQVQVVAIMVAGFLLGPSVLGWLWPAAQQWLFPTKLTIGAETFTHPNLTAIYVVGQLGLVLYMFLVGASFKLDILGAHLRQAGATSAAGIGVPLILGGVVGWWMVSVGGYFTDRVVHWQGGLFVAAAVAITAFPMLAWIIYDSGLLDTRLGTMSLSCAAVDDACSWVLLATVVATAKGSLLGAFLAIGGGLGYLLFMVYIGRPLLVRLESWTPRRADVERTGGVPIAHVSIVLLVVLAASWFTDVVGIYSVFGAFVAGAAMPRGALLDAIRERFEPLTAYLLIPAFFIYSGLNTQLTLILDGPTLLMAAVVLVVSFAAKFGAVGLAARWQGMSWHEAGSMGALANARGLMELILLNIGFEAALISGKLYTILALMTIITTLVATPLQRLFERRLRRSGSRFGRDGEEPSGDVPRASSKSSLDTAPRSAPSTFTGRPT
ncbi:cation:proton antiporter [Mycobacterium sp. ITM-2016-00318]|uniref:cation:proton antiporter n=1 Tax=Mycobacterium sp. ITM-2016-00318 TaxID=2099693 RepID=UPI001E5C7F51|nr:cation:proton antiporter [Mycobacterium sp. ITM-2016-00318]WNG92879.1 cation:proton antiporter [Mycobacterium sp. ITM-2016-00318]